MKKMNNFLEWFQETTEKAGHLLIPATAAKLLGTTRQYLNRLEEAGRIKKHYYEKQPYIGMNDINKEILRRQNKQKHITSYKRFEMFNNEMIANVDHYPPNLLNEWIKEWELYFEDKEIKAFLDTKYCEWAEKNAEMAKEWEATPDRGEWGIAPAITEDGTKRAIILKMTIDKDVVNRPGHQPKSLPKDTPRMKIIGVNSKFVKPKKNKSTLQKSPSA